MMWNQLVQIMFGSSLIVAQTAWPNGQKPASVRELESYNCAKTVGARLYPEDQPGPVFANGDLIFTSLEASDNSLMLVVSAGAGVYSLPLNRVGVNRLRFTLPTLDAPKGKEFFLSYLHDPLNRSRFFDFSAARPPVGKGEFDFKRAVPRRGENLLPNLEFKTHETAESILSSLTNGDLNRTQLRAQSTVDCERLRYSSPALAKLLLRNLEVVEMIVSGPVNKSARVIAAVASVTVRAEKAGSSGRIPASTSSGRLWDPASRP